MIQKLLDEPYFPDLDKIIEKQLEFFPYEALSSQKGLSPLSSVMYFLTEPSSGCRPKSPHPTNNHLQIKTWIESHLPEVKKELLDMIKNSISDRKASFPVELLEKRREIALSDNVQESYDYFMTLHMFRMKALENAK